MIGLGGLMMYWTGVYVLVIIAALIPFIVLYIVAGALWLSLRAVRLIAGRFKHALILRRCFLTTHG